MELMTKTVDELKGKPYVSWYSGQETYLETTGEVPMLRFRADREADWLGLAFSTRLGGVSSGHLSSMNLGWDRGEPRENVCENYKRICRAMGVNDQKLVLSDQVHDKKVCYVDESFAAGEEMTKKLQGIDGLVTDIPGLVLATSYADCVPLFFYDTRCRLIASSHSGWKGTVLKIGEATLETMQERGSRLEDIHVVIGPSICQECYEVSEDVAKQFHTAYGEECCRDILKKGRNIQGEQKYQLDLWAANWHQLVKAGISPSHVHISGVCTCCNHELLYSHRYTNGKRGNLNGFLYIKP